MITDLNYAATGGVPSSPELTDITGIPLLDERLAATVASGGIELVSGHYKTGKTMLVSQIAARFAMGRHRVDFISTQANATGGSEGSIKPNPTPRRITGASAFPLPSSVMRKPGQTTSVFLVYRK